MSYLLDYVEGQLATFEQEPFNAVDAAVLSQMCMISADFAIPALQEQNTFTDGHTILKNRPTLRQKPARFSDLLRAEHFETMFTGFTPEKLRDALFAVASSPRFRNLRIRDYLSLFDTDEDTQFAAMTFVYKKKFAFVCFRGTDESITGWKEDFDMAYSMPVPAQAQAAHYLEAVEPSLPGLLYVGGHSKGGNLAEYAALKASKPIQDRIERVYILDGPGFKEGILTEQDYEPIIDRMYKIVPEDAIIGTLMNSPVPLHVVPSNDKGFGQHSVFTWEVFSETVPLLPVSEAAAEDEDDPTALERAADALEKIESLKNRIAPKKPVKRIGTDFVYLDELSDTAQILAETISKWLARYNDNERLVMVETLFRMLESTGITTFDELIGGGSKTLNVIADAAQNASEEERELFKDAGRELAEIAASVTANRVGKGVAQGVRSGASKVAKALREGVENARASREREREREPKGLKRGEA